MSCFRCPGHVLTLTCRRMVRSLSCFSPTSFDLFTLQPAELLNVTSAWISACFGSLNSRNFRCTPQLCKSIPREEGSEPVRRRRATEDFVHVSLAFHRRGTLESRSLDSDGQATPVTLAPSLASFASTSLTALPPERGLFSAVFSSVAFFPPVHFHFFLPPLTVALVLIRATAAALALVAAVHCAPLVPDGVGTDLTNATIESIPYNATNTETTPITGNDPYDGTNYTLAAPYTPAGGDQQRKPTCEFQPSLRGVWRKLCVYDNSFEQTEFRATSTSRV